MSMLNATGKLVEQIAAHEATIDRLTSELTADRARAERWKAEAMAWRVSAAWNINMTPVDANWRFEYGNEVLRTRFVNDTAEPPQPTEREEGTR